LKRDAARRARTLIVRKNYAALEATEDDDFACFMKGDATARVVVRS